MDENLIRALREQIPGLKSQAQFLALVAAIDAVKLAAKGIVERDPSREFAGRDALQKSLDALRQVTEVTEKLDAVPEAASSTAAKAFKEPPVLEGEVQRALLTALRDITSVRDLSAWYSDNRAQIDQVQGQALRNALLDAVRAKKAELTLVQETT